MKSFQKLYKETIQYVENTIPKSVSAGVCGAVAKAILWYGKDKIAPFAEAFSKRNYQGINDPVHVLWEWLIRNGTGKRNIREIYRKTVTAIRAYLRNAPLDSSKLTPAIEDVFEWSNNYKTMSKPKYNQWTKFSSKPKRILLY